MRDTHQIRQDRAREEVTDAVRSLSPDEAVRVLEDCLDAAKRARREYNNTLA